MRVTNADLVFYRFSRWKVERGAFGHFMSLSAPEKLPSGRRLREMMGTMVFCIDGYDQDEREIHTIPEIRRFYSTFHAAWPHWLYFCNLEIDNLKTMVMRCLPSLSDLKMEGQPRVAITFDPLHLLGFLRQDFAPMNMMCERAGMFEERIYDRTRAIFEYFGLPFEGGTGEGDNEAADQRRPRG